MRKNTTLQLKGIAILLMLWLHLFSDEKLTATCVNTIWFWNGMPLAVGVVLKVEDRWMKGRKARSLTI